MADAPSSGDAGLEPKRESTTGTPRWVKVFATIALVGVVLFVILLFAGGDHGPGRHTDGARSYEAAASITEQLALLTWP